MALLPDLPEYRTGLIIVGLARCIAMVIIWNDLACGDREAAAVLVALNSIFQVVAFAGLGWFYLSWLPGRLGLEQDSLDVSTWQIATSVLVFLGVPLVLGYLSRRVGEKRWGRTAYEGSFLPRIGPWALYGLLFTIVVLFALQGDQITSRPWDVARIALPLLAYFALMWGGGFALGRALGMTYERTTTLAFTAAGNNFELAIAVAIATFGVTSGQALAGVVGPLIEVPVLVGLVYVSLALRPPLRRRTAEPDRERRLRALRCVRTGRRGRRASGAPDPRRPGRVAAAAPRHRAGSTLRPSREMGGECTPLADDPLRPRRHPGRHIPLIVASYQHAFREVRGEEIDEVRRPRLDRAAPCLGALLEEDPERGHELDRTYREWNLANTSRLIQRYAGVPEMLTALTDAGAAVHVVTSKRRETARLALAAVGIDHLVDVVGALEDTTRHKPDPEPLLAAARALGDRARAPPSTSATPRSTSSPPVRPAWPRSP